MDTPPERSIIFLSPSVEEAGMLGSQHYVDNPVFPHNKTVACFNSDVIMFIGRFKDVTVTGLGHSELDKFLEEEAAKQGRYICNDPNPENGMFFRSDQMPFLKAGVPSLFAKGYSHQVDMGREETLKAVAEYWRTTYHKPSDHYIPEIHNLDGLVEDTHLFFGLGLKLANSSYFPKWSSNSEFYEER
jgi:Zn-dependent M28 family amino/carboxypeptidase